MTRNEMYIAVRNQDALEYCKKKSMLEQMVGDEKWKHYEYAARALEKQTPKKVVSEKYFYGYTYHCPCCKSQVTKRAYIASDRYCYECGQALDWSE